MKSNVILGILFLFFLSCKKTPMPLPAVLPPITEEGLNTFGCMIGEEIYVPEIRRTIWSIPGPQSSPIELSFPQYPEYNLRVSTIRLVEEDDILNDAFVEFIIAENVSDTGEYIFTHTTVEYEENYYYDIDENCGILKVTKLDTINRIISGTFQFEVVNINSTILKNLQVTNGRFDLKYDQR